MYQLVQSQHSLPPEVDLTKHGVSGSFIPHGVDERRVADPPFSLIGVCDRLEGTAGDDGGVARDLCCRCGDPKL